jgi:hypothetical protein
MKTFFPRTTLAQDAPNHGLAVEVLFPQNHGIASNAR